MNVKRSVHNRHRYGVGKTIVAGAIIKAMRAKGTSVCGMKPIETGCRPVGDTLCPEDGIFLKKISGADEDLENITPCCFETPAAPYVASGMEEKEVDIDLIINKFEQLSKKYDRIVVEGIGGILVPLKKDYFVTDLIKRLGLPAIIVSRPSLGTINHTLLTVRYAMDKGIDVKGIIINCSQPDDGTVAAQTNEGVIRQLSPAPVIGTFPYLKKVDEKILGEAALTHLSLFH